jgi:transmembrane sensor
MQKLSRRWIFASVAVAAMSVALTLGWWMSEGARTYRTGRGEQKTLRLDDGSVLQLNTLSRARVAFTGHARVIDLQGEGLFTVAHDASRPFLVRTRGATARAIGTRFNVYEQGRVTKISVVEGVVQVSPTTSGESGIRAETGAQPSNDGSLPTSSRALDISAGEEARVAAGAATKAQLPNVAVAVAWQNRALVFERAKLADVALEFNRYNESQFRIDAAVGESNHLSGTFDAGHPQSLLLWLQSRSDLKVTRQGDVFLVESR